LLQGKTKDPPPVGGISCHGDLHNPPKDYFSDSVSVHVPVRDGNQIVRESRIYNQRRSAVDFCKRHREQGPLVNLLSENIMGMPRQLRSSPEEYFGYIGNVGVIYVWDKYKQEFVVVGLETDAAINKPMCWLSPIVYMIECLAECEPDGKLSHEQLSIIEWIASFQCSVITMYCVLSAWLQQGGIPKSNIVEHFMKDCITLFGSMLAGPRPRSVVSATHELTPENIKRSISIVTQLRKQTIARQRSQTAGCDNPISSTEVRSDHNRYHKLASKSDGMFNCGPFTSNNFVHIGAMTGTLFPPDLLDYACVAKENHLHQKMKEELKRAPTNEETSQMLRNIAQHLQISESSAESGTCEPNRKNKKVDFCGLGQPFYTLCRSSPKMPASLVRWVLLCHVVLLIDDNSL